MTKKKKHHITPQFYLRKWCHKDGRLNRAANPQNKKWLFDRKLPEDVSFEKYFYKINGSSGDSIDFEDDIITDLIDTPFSALYKIIIQHGINSLSDKERKRLAIYLASFQARSPRLLNECFEKIIDAYKNDSSQLELDIKELSKKSGKNLSEKQIKSFIEDIENNFLSIFKSRRDLGKFIMAGVITGLGSRADILLEMEWYHFRTNQHYSAIITTDFPMVSIGDFGDPESVHIFPLTPCDVLVMSNNAAAVSHIFSFSDTKLLAFFNAVIVGNAREAYSKYRGHENFIKKFLGRLLNRPVLETNVYFAKVIDEAFNYLPFYIFELNSGLDAEFPKNPPEFVPR